MSPEELLKNGLKKLNIPCSNGQIDSFMTFLFELKKWNRAYSLSGLRYDRDIIIKHFLDSLLYIKAIPEGELKLADAGSGAGFPGIPIKIVRPELDVTLVESSRKKAAFLRHIIRLIELTHITVLEQRLESLGEEHKGKYDVIVSRATFKIKEFLSVACPYVKKNGRAVLSKGQGFGKELKDLEDRNAVKKILKFNLPFTTARRNIIILEC
jgi:16S rRNA (guanine527-N7)-methyltransferase